MRLFIMALCLFALTEAKVSFTYSTLYDEFDLNGVSEIPLEACTADGCSIYISTPESNVEVTKNLVVASKGTSTYVTLDAYTSRYDGVTNEKIGLQLTSGNFVILNYNTKPVGPIVIYVFSTKAALNNPYLEIYDAHNFKRANRPATTITILSAEPFTVSADSYEKGNAVVARATGFDDADDSNKDGCFQLLAVADSKAWPGFSVEVSSPIISFAFDKKYSTAYVHMRASTGIMGQLDLRNPGFVTSPGYIGCRSGDVFRSSLYKNQVEVVITAPSNGHVYINGDIHTDASHPVDIIDLKTNQDYPMYGVTAAQSQELFTSGVEVDWYSGGTNNSFALRFSSVAV